MVKESNASSSIKDIPAVSSEQITSKRITLGVLHLAVLRTIFHKFRGTRKIRNPQNTAGGIVAGSLYHVLHFKRTAKYAKEVIKEVANKTITV